MLSAFLSGVKIMKKILVMLGPNLNMVGIREKGVYGAETAEALRHKSRTTH